MDNHDEDRINPIIVDDNPILNPAPAANDNPPASSEVVDVVLSEERVIQAEDLDNDTTHQVEVTPLQKRACDYQRGW